MWRHTQRLVGAFSGQLVHVRGVKSDPRISVQLLRDVEGLGYRGEIKEVKPGHARNVLVPTRAAIFAPRERTKKNAETVNLGSAVVSRLRDQLAEKFAQGLKFNKYPDAGGASLRKMIGAQDIADRMLRSHNVLLDPSAIELRSPISSYGEFTVPVSFGSDMKVQLKVHVNRRKDKSLEA